MGWDDVDNTDTINSIYTDTDFLQVESEHLTYIFPSITNRTVTFTASATANTYSYWHEITDNNASTLTMRAASNILHLSAIQLENALTKDKKHMLEIGYGVGPATVIIVSRHRFISATNLLNTIEQPQIRSVSFPAGQKIFYRMMAEAGTASCDAMFRYHYHD